MVADVLDGVSRSVDSIYAFRLHDDGRQPLLKIADRAIGEGYHGLRTGAERASQRLLERDMIEPASPRPAKLPGPSV
jgi:hypothetical protein